MRHGLESPRRITIRRKQALARAQKLKSITPELVEFFAWSTTTPNE